MTSHRCNFIVVGAHPRAQAGPRTIIINRPGAAPTGIGVAIVGCDWLYLTAPGFTELNQAHAPSVKKRSYTVIHLSIYPLIAQRL